MSEPLVASALWMSLIILAYTFVGYPLVLGLRSGARGGGRPSALERPAVSVVVAAFNEQDAIREKVANVLQQLRPNDELIAVSDGSTDATDTLVAGIDDPRLRLERQVPRQGKNAALNLGVRGARGTVLVFTDATALLGPGALGLLVEALGEPAAGLVSGQGLYGGTTEGDLEVVSNAYVRYEAFIRRGEAAHGFMAGVDGALYAMRRELYENLPVDEVHDLWHPIEVALANRATRFEPAAFTVEPPSRTTAGEWHRQVRIIAQGFRVLARAIPALLRAGRMKELWMLLSHRLLRWTSWFFVVVGVAANVALVDVHALYQASLAGQGLFFGIALLGAMAERLSLNLRVFAVPYVCCVVSTAGLVGLVEALRGRSHAVWTRQEGAT